ALLEPRHAEAAGARGDPTLGARAQRLLGLPGSRDEHLARARPDRAGRVPRERDGAAVHGARLDRPRVVAELRRAPERLAAVARCKEPHVARAAEPVAPHEAELALGAPGDARMTALADVL